jgi:hypothetical protein
MSQNPPPSRGAKEGRPTPQAPSPASDGAPCLSFPSGDSACLYITIEVVIILGNKLIWRRLRSCAPLGTRAGFLAGRFVPKCLPNAGVLFSYPGIAPPVSFGMGTGNLRTISISFLFH